jgi:hypothetical protein
MKIANAKSVVAKLIATSMLTGVAAATLMIANPAKAQAQNFAVGVRVGDPGYAQRGRIVVERRPEVLRREEFARRQEFLRHQEWERSHHFDRRDGYRYR